MTTHPMSVVNHRPIRHALLATRHRQLTARRKRATGRVGYPVAPRDTRQTLLAGLRQGRQQFTGIRVRRLCEQCIAAGHFHQPPGVHHPHLICHAPRHAQIMRNQQQPHLTLLLNLLQQCQYLRLHRNIQRRGRFIRDEQRRIACQTQGDHDALFQPARQLKRKRIYPAFSIRHPHTRQQCRHLGTRRLAG